ncbi:hypothetical protein FB451DRAFT_1257790 [Mycena latifolia]|nr:hypothetical protein FB451DRAFT_1257790 [Mycena latifolia]
MFNGQERDLPPLPDEAIRKNEGTQPDYRRPPAQGAPSFAIPLKISSPRPLAPSLAKLSAHELLLTHKSDMPLLRPKLRLETDWDSQRYPVSLHSADVSLHSADDVSNASCHSASQSLSSIHSTTSQDNLLPAHLPHHASPLHDVYTTPQRSPTRSACRFLNAVRLPKMAAVVCAAHKKAATSRAVDPHLDRIVAKPFMRSDAGPLHGVTVTVHRQCLVSEPMLLPLPLPPNAMCASSSSLSLVAAEKPLPTPPAIPGASDDQWDGQSEADADVDADSIESPSAFVSASTCPPTPAPTSKSSALPVPGPAFVHMGRPPSGAKRRKHYRVHRAPGASPHA